MCNILYDFIVEYDNLKPNQIYLAQIKVNLHFWNKVVVNPILKT